MAAGACEMAAGAWETASRALLGGSGGLLRARRRWRRPAGSAGGSVRAVSGRRLGRSQGPSMAKLPPARPSGPGSIRASAPRRRSARKIRPPRLAARAAPRSWPWPISATPSLTVRLTRARSKWVRPPRRRAVAAVSGRWARSARFTPKISPPSTVAAARPRGARRGRRGSIRRRRGRPILAPGRGSSAASRDRRRGRRGRSGRRCPGGGHRCRPAGTRARPAP